MHLPLNFNAPFALVDSVSWTLFVLIVGASFALAYTTLIEVRRSRRWTTRRSSVHWYSGSRTSRSRLLGLRGVARLTVLGALFLCVALASSTEKKVAEKPELAAVDADSQVQKEEINTESIREVESTVKWIPFVKGSEVDFEEVAYPSTDSSATKERSGGETWSPNVLATAGTDRKFVDNRVEPLKNAGNLNSSDADSVVKSKAYPPNAQVKKASSSSLRVGSVQPTSFDEIRREINSERLHIVQPGGLISPSPSSYSHEISSPDSAAYVPFTVSNEDEMRPSDSALYLERVNEELYECFSKVRDSVLRISVVKPVVPGSERCVDESGSGVVILYKSKPYLLTNYHIIDGAKAKDNIRVDLPNGAQISPVSVYSCPDYDLAALEIEIYDLLRQQIVKPCVVGDCNDLREGQFIMALGNPCLLRNSVTFGVVGGLRRDYNDLKNLGINSCNKLAEFIQLSALINPGNSGGAIYNVRGQVVGIATATLVTNVPTGIGFAVPISDAIMVMKSMIDKGAWLPSKFGVNLAPLSYAELKTLGLNRPCGARILEVQKGLPADLSGVKPGDVVLSLNDVEVESDLHFARLVALAGPDATTRMEIMRDNSRIEIVTRFTSGSGVGEVGSNSSNHRR